MPLSGRRREKEKPPVQSGMFRRRTGLMSQPRPPYDPAEQPAGTPTPPADGSPAPCPSPPDQGTPDAESPPDQPVELPRLQTPRKGRRLSRPAPTPAAPLSA